MANFYVSAVQCPRTDHKKTQLGLSLATAWILRNPPTPTQPGPSETSGFVFPFRNLWLVWLQLQWIFVQSFMLRTSEIPQQTIEENQIMWRRPANNVQNSWLKGCKTNLGNGSIFKIWVSWLQIWGISYVIMWSGELRLIWVGGFVCLLLFVCCCFCLHHCTGQKPLKRKVWTLKKGSCNEQLVLLCPRVREKEDSTVKAAVSRCKYAGMLSTFLWPC